ncbi:hypothetical protein KP509_12G040100 [Ceratopteris richardii]|uniref:Uncharacterized protein n=1 Tax=Ceratopteris richardii TaxID=49495 RepID=A0A8T2TMU2_CERRI|nr:hypothetical protein KP509_12G040100 [Ceratopteris richardii]
MNMASAVQKMSIALLLAVIAMVATLAAAQAPAPSPVAMDSAAPASYFIPSLLSPVLIAFLAFLLH